MAEPPGGPPQGLCISPPDQSTSQVSLALECSICTNPYGLDFGNTARVLKCGHSFCTNCLSRLMTTRSIKCPICAAIHQVTRPDILHLSPNYAVIQLLTGGATKSTITPPDTLCEYGTCSPKNPASIVCIDCQPGSQVKFCVDCDRVEHNRPFPPVQRHRRFPIGEEPSPPIPVCTKHHNNEATVYSLALNEFACPECQLDPNWSNQEKHFEPLDQVVARVRSRTQRLNQYSRDSVEKLTIARRALQAIIDELGPSVTGAKTTIQTTFTEIIGIIQERQQDLLKRVEQEYDDRKENLESQLRRVEQTVQDFANANEDLNTLMPRPDIEFLVRHRPICDKLERLLIDEDKSLQRPVARHDIPVFVPNEILGELRNLGAVGGGPVPQDLNCAPADPSSSLFELQWQMPPNCGVILRQEIEFEHLPNKEKTGLRGSNLKPDTYHNTEPQYQEIPGGNLGSFVNGLCPGYKYRFRIRSANAAGWGMWSNTLVGTQEGFPINIGFTKRIHQIRIPLSGYYRIHARGAKAKDGMIRSGGCGAIISATFPLTAGDILIVLSGGMSDLNVCDTGGGGGTFVALNVVTQENLLVAAGGGGGTRGLDERDEDGRDASLETWGTDGRGIEHGKGGRDGEPGEDANQFPGPCWGYGGAGFSQNSKTARSFKNGGFGGQCGGFGGGGAVGLYGGGGGGGYSGGGGGRGGGGGGSYVRDDGINVRKLVGNDTDGSVRIEKVVTPDLVGSSVPVDDGTVSSMAIATPVVSTSVPPPASSIVVAPSRQSSTASVPGLLSTSVSSTLTHPESLSEDDTNSNSASPHSTETLTPVPSPDSNV